MCKDKGCPEAKKFDAETSYRRLSKKYNDLSEIVAAYFNEADIKDRSVRASSARAMADHIFRIVGGSRVPEGAYPECCLVGSRNPNGTLEWFCTGVLVHPRIVLTAGHCYKQSKQFVVALNTINQNTLASAEIIDVKTAVPHPGYMQTRKLFDISVLVLRQPAQTIPVPVAMSAEINAAFNTTLVGFGNEDVNSTVGFGIKREVTVPVVSIRRTPQDTLDAEEIRYDYESDMEFVAGGAGYDSCNGDSGGPAYIIAGGVRKLAGLTSRGTAGSQHLCGDGGVYTRVDAHMSFIESNIPAQ